MLTTTTFSVLTLISLSLSIPIAEIFGSLTCWVFWFSTLTLNCELALSGIAMAVYRLLCLKNPTIFQTVIGHSSLIKVMIVCEIVISGLIINQFFHATSTSGKNPVMEFCLGQTLLEAEVFWAYGSSSGSPGETGSNQGALKQSIVIIVSASPIWLEMLIYVVIYSGNWQFITRLFHKTTCSHQTPLKEETRRMPSP